MTSMTAGHWHSFDPRRTLPVSVTGQKCALQCDHCRGRYLRHMSTVHDALDMPVDAYDSVLLSGGCDEQGRVLTREHLPILRQFAERGIRINAHLGLARASDIADLCSFIDVASVDFIADPLVAERVFGFSPGTRYVDVLSGVIAAGCTVAPHICIGVDRGRESSELQSLTAAAELGVSRVVLLAFIPTPHTPVAGLAPPELSLVERVFSRAVELFGAGAILGCMRPGGRYRQDIDKLAVDCGISGIVRPSPGAVASAKAKGLTMTCHEECCAL